MAFVSLCCDRNMNDVMTPFQPEKMRENTRATRFLKWRHSRLPQHRDTRIKAMFYLLNLDVQETIL